MDDNLTKLKIESLDGKMPDVPWTQEDLWGSIDEKLDKRSRRLPMFKYGAAAVILLALGLSFFFRNHETSLHYSTERTASISEDLPEPAEGSEARAFIDSKCLEGLEICLSPRFQELYLELQGLDDEKSILEEMIFKYGEDPSLIKSKVKIENREVLVTNELVKIIMS